MPEVTVWDELDITEDEYGFIQRHKFAAAAGTQDCRVYWGSHGCALVRNHPGQCMCECAWDGSPRFASGRPLPAMPPYYGPDTTFYGEDAEARGLPLRPSV